MTISSEQFRDALRHFPSGVTVVTIKSGAEIHGLAVSAFDSVSPDPPLIAIIIDHRHRAHALLEQEGAAFAVNILHEKSGRSFGPFCLGRGPRPLPGRELDDAATGAPVLADALAWLDCTILSRHAAGTHTIYVGKVEASGLPQPDGPPLVYWNRGYRQLRLWDTG